MQGLGRAMLTIHVWRRPEHLGVLLFTVYVMAPSVATLLVIWHIGAASLAAWCWMHR